MQTEVDSDLPNLNTENEVLYDCGASGWVGMGGGATLAENIVLRHVSPVVTHISAFIYPSLEYEWASLTFLFMPEKL